MDSSYLASSTKVDSTNYYKEEPHTSTHAVKKKQLTVLTQANEI
jgi:hypothetical protein